MGQRATRYYRIILDGFEHEEQAIVMRMDFPGSMFGTDRFDYRSDGWVDDGDLYFSVFLRGNDDYEEIPEDEARALIARGREMARGL